MLKYLITGTETLIVAGVLTGMLSAYRISGDGKRGRAIAMAGALLGILAAAVMSYLKNKTKLIDTGMWNIRIFSVSLTAFVLFLLADLPPVRKRTGEPGRIAIDVLAAVLVFCQLFYALPDIMGYPYTIVLGGDPVMSTGFLYRIIGLTIGIILVIVSAVAVCQVSVRLDSRITGTLMKLALLVNACHQISKIVQTLLTRRRISGHTLFQIVKFTSNHSQMFIFLVMLFAVVIPIILLILSLRVNEPYSNPAEHRKIRAKWRSCRRWSALVIVCFFLVTLNLTAIKAYANRPVELSPVEECEQHDGACYIAFEQVEDGHLHRFAYTNEKGISIRFIIIKKPNSSAYGIGLDACDICGETGYFERNGQVVCKLCDVVMNINTIGFKGGCNPKVIDYSIANGHIIVPFDTLNEHADDFK